MPPSTRWLLPLLCAPAFLQAGDLATPTVAKFIRILALATGPGKAACADKEMAWQLSAAGIAVEGDAQVVWATSEKDVVKFARQGKLVVCGDLDLLAAGGSVAIVAEGGRPTIYLNPKHLAATGVTLPDNILKLSKVVK